ncbi:hypothetical protein D3C78_1544860 [compost metagenome]
MLYRAGTAQTTADQFSSFGDAGGDELLDFQELRLANDRAHIRAISIGITNADSLGNTPRDFQSLSMPISGHQHASRGVTGLAGIRKTAQYP